MIAARAGKRSVQLIARSNYLVLENCANIFEEGKRCAVPFELEERFVIAAEQQLGASLPSSYRRAMMLSNGGRVHAFDDVWDLYPILDKSDRKRLKRSCNDIL